MTSGLFRIQMKQIPVLAILYEGMGNISNWMRSAKNRNLMHNKVPNYLHSAGKAGTRTGERGHTRSTARVAEIPRNRNTVNY
jgi:hypothetical protein